MKSRKIYRDGLEEEIVGPIHVSTTSDGHTIEKYKLVNGNIKYFATISGSHWCAHGDTLVEAIADALWKDPEKRPSREALVEEIRQAGKSRKINLNEFRLLTGACLSGCRTALANAKKDNSPITADDIKNHVSKEWGNKLLSILGWLHHD